DGTMLAELLQDRPANFAGPINIEERLITRHGYKMFDLSVIYRQPLGSRHVLNASLGASYCMGRGTYVFAFFVNLMDDYRRYDTQLVKEDFIGLFPALS